MNGGALRQRRGAARRGAGLIPITGLPAGNSIGREGYGTPARDRLQGAPEDTMTITFYYTPQSNASRIHASLEELGLKYEKVKIDLRAGEQRKPEFLALNPNGKVPTLVIDGTPMFESVAIQIALGERYGVEKGLWPALGSPEHLQALTWIVWGQVTLGAELMRYLQNTSDWIAKEMHHPPQAEAAMKEIHTCLGILNARLSERENLTGSSFTLADLDLAAVLGWGLHVAKVDMAGYPKVSAWLERAAQRPGMRTSMAADS
jgi:GST-like protein